MIAEFSVHDTDAYSVEQLLASPENPELIKGFKVGENAYGLENYLKEVAESDETNNFSRTYLVKDRVTGEVVSYFSLRTGLITMQVEKPRLNFQILQ